MNIKYLRMLRNAFIGDEMAIKVNKLYTYFMSAQNEKEKLERLTTFLKSVFVRIRVTILFVT